VKLTGVTSTPLKLDASRGYAQGRTTQNGVEVDGLHLNVVLAIRCGRGLRDEHAGKICALGTVLVEIVGCICATQRNPIEHDFAEDRVREIGAIENCV
jgi:hypothetical protein